MGTRIISFNHIIGGTKEKGETIHHYFQTDITLENLLWAARRQGFISYQRLNQAQGIADQNWSSASSLLIQHLYQLANQSHREGRPAF